MNHTETLRTAMLKIVQDAQCLAQAENIAHVALAATAEPAQDDLTAQLADMTAKYQELIYQVGKKYPGESRHQTALRYLGQAEQDDTDYSVAAIAATKVEQIERP